MKREKIPEIRYHSSCGGYWLEKTIDENKIAFRCTRCGEWIIEERNREIERRIRVKPV